jgi:hypothetical protein
MYTYLHIYRLDSIYAKQKGIEFDTIITVHNLEDLGAPGTTTVSPHHHIHLTLPLIVLHMRYTSYLATVPPHGAAGSRSNCS